MDEELLRRLTPEVLGVLCRRGADFASAEDAVQEALLDAWRTWPSEPPRDPKGWLVTTAWRRHLDAVRADTSRRRREDVVGAEAIRLTRALAALDDHPETGGLLALMLLHHARRASRWTPEGALVPLAEQDRSLWDTALVAEGVAVLQAALARDRLGEFQAQAAIAALHADARTAQETDWVQVVEWYDELVRLTDSPVVRLNRAVAVGQADGPGAGLRALAELDPALPRYDAVAAHLHERNGDPLRAATLYSEAALRSNNPAERDHLMRQAARLNSAT
ncbi:RNA polymerase subunit sigma [Tessaracoccus rhinocerotis]|uniref:RNA polymerase subunit sigma n=1 Tax=Tessaracoccus rhinocerotis TaxID=1689449 RepID=A0A553K5N1_9ACTN|nr:DUF6596 domain-containing protein [Tessaracoccus rhinocerotis]TRY20013.1 RNA polymerase subunit sigma [Tessaracoccus rhinocerotis]